jgi:transporter family-2 protein
MKAIFYVFGLFLGIILALHLSMNGKVGATLDNPRVGNALFWSIGAVAAILIGATGWHPGALSNLKEVNPLLLTAGAIGASLVFCIAWMLPQIGARGMFVTLIAGQIIGGMMFSHYGLLGSPVQRVTAINGVGALILLGGALLATYVRA